MARYVNTRYDWQRNSISRENHPEFLPQGQGLERMARPTKIKSERQGIEKKIAQLQGQLTVAKTNERHTKENAQPKTMKVVN